MCLLFVVMTCRRIHYSLAGVCMEGSRAPHARELLSFIGFRPVASFLASTCIDSYWYIVSQLLFPLNCSYSWIFHIVDTDDLSLLDRLRQGGLPHVDATEPYEPVIDYSDDDDYAFIDDTDRDY